ncbi:response regulator [Sphingomonas solaris]|uniref:Response regulator n=1 Tax=Alterirhizorhabdus solaris TaxID=2529389 RepID=A0A558R374_9SPHN|nr:response regulator [Sphingomonas solaris]TVV73792.1 response regulator [Sphingomonas solaris]
MTTPLTVLYVDDDDDIRSIATMSLELDPDMTVAAAASGAEALALLEDESLRPDVILLDVMMPEMDGPTLARHLCVMPRLRGVPLLFMTARARQADIAGYYALGAAAVISKPFDPLGLAAEIRAVLARIEG